MSRQTPTRSGARDAAQDLLQVLQPVAEAVALAGGDLQTDPRGGARAALGVHLVQRPGHQREPRPGRRVGARVEHERGDAERLAPRAAPPTTVARRALAEDGVLRGEVDQVAAVGDGRKRRRCAPPGGRPGARPASSGGRGPAARRAGEDLQARPPSASAARPNGQGDAAGDGGRARRASPRPCGLS